MWPMYLRAESFRRCSNKMFLYKSYLFRNQCFTTYNIFCCNDYFVASIFSNSVLCDNVKNGYVLFYRWTKNFGLFLAINLEHCHERPRTSISCMHRALKNARWEESYIEVVGWHLPGLLNFLQSETPLMTITITAREQCGERMVKEYGRELWGRTKGRYMA